MLETIKNKLPPLTAFQLKLLALVTMFCDHFAVVFLIPRTDSYMALRTIGRLAFPIYAFLLVEGFFHTRSVKRYAVRLALFALVSEIPFNLALSGRPWYWHTQNVYFTLVIGLIMVAAMDHLIHRGMRWQAMGAGLLAVGAAMLLRTDYDAAGILAIFFFYLYREERIAMCIAVSAVLALFIGGLECFGILALIPILLYNGQKGAARINKFVFYGFYPAHLFLLWLVSRL